MRNEEPLKQRSEPVHQIGSGSRTNCRASTASCSTRPARSDSAPPSCTRINISSRARAGISSAIRMPLALAAVHVAVGARHPAGRQPRRLTRRVRKDPEAAPDFFGQRQRVERGIGERGLRELPRDYHRGARGDKRPVPLRAACLVPSRRPRTCHREVDDKHKAGTHSQRHEALAVRGVSSHKQVLPGGARARVGEVAEAAHGDNPRHRRGLDVRAEPAVKRDWLFVALTLIVLRTLALSVAVAF